jgi:uncharacterized membrane protein YeaQ/YmgE (transglycosylase-associated protein family)
MNGAEGIVRRIASILFGLFAGALATFIHFALVPVGLIIALIGSLACSLVVRSFTRSRLTILLFAIAWSVVVYRGGITSGEELLIIANTPGYTLLYLGPLLVFLPAVLPRPKIFEPGVAELQ